METHSFVLIQVCPFALLRNHSSCIPYQVDTFVCQISAECISSCRCKQSPNSQPAGVFWNTVTGLRFSPP